MTSTTKYRKFASVLIVSLLNCGVASPLLADDAGYQAREIQNTRAQTGQLLQVDDEILLGDARNVTGSDNAATTRNERTGEDEGLTASEELWERAERHSEFGP